MKASPFARLTIFRTRLRSIAVVVGAIVVASLAASPRPTTTGAVPNNKHAQQFGMTSNNRLVGPAKPSDRTHAKQLVSPEIQSSKLGELRAQAPRIEAATAIQQLAANHGFDGFAGAALEGANLVLYWHGELPAEAATTVNRFRNEFEVEVRNAPYSPSELNEEAHRISRKPGVSGAGILSDFSGLWVGVVDANKSAQLLNQLDSKVKIVPRTKGQTAPLAWRWGDFEPYWGGGVVEHRSGSWPSYTYSYCTVGFPTRRYSDNLETMTLSDHCGNPNDEWHTYEGERTVGRTVTEDPGIDGAYLSGKQYEAMIFTGPNNSSSGVRLNGSVYPVRGMLVCYEGAFSGASCGSYVTDIGVWEDGIGPGFWTEDQFHDAAAGQGDSGGPVLAGSTGTGLNGVGIVTLGDLNTQTTCQGLGDRICSWRVFNTTLPTALDRQGLALQTLP